MTRKRIHLIYSILLSAALVVAGLCLIAACVGIYRMGSRPFSPEAVAAAFQDICIPVYLCLLLLLGSIVLHLFYPAEEKKKPVEKQYHALLQRQRARVDLQYCAPHLRKNILREEEGRSIHKIISLVLLGLCSAGFLLYGANMRNFPLENINEAMIKAMYLLLPCLAVPFGYGIFTAYYCRRSICREIDLLKQATAQGCPAPAPAEQAPAPAKYLPILKASVLVLAVGLLLFGLLTGGTVDVLTKAVNICTECVGLG